MNHDQQGSSQSKSTGGVPSLPSVLAPLAGYRYAKSVGDRELMLTEAQKFKGKLYDERIKMTEKHNKEVRGLESKLGEAQTNLEIAKGSHKTQTDILKRDVTAMRSHVNRLMGKLIDAGIDAGIAEGVGHKTGRYIEMWEQKNGKKFEDLDDADRDEVLRLAANKPLMEAKAIIANQGIQSGVEPDKEDVSNIAAGGRPTELTDAEAIAIDWLIKNENLTKEEALKYLESRRSSRTSSTGRKLTDSQMNTIANNISSQIISTIWGP